jgi:FdhD protein
VAITRVERIELDGGARRAEDDDLVDEAPLTLTARGREASVTMRTPGDDLELVRGLLFAEGGAALAARGLRQVDADTVDIDADPSELAPRSFMATSACGVCGRIGLTNLDGRATPITSDLAVPAAVLAAVPDTLRTAQARFATTGGLHGAGILDGSGLLLAAREDVGRHNALDKVVGWALAQGRLPLSQCVLLVSGRVSYEIVQKAIVAGIPVLAAVGAPSSLAVDLSEKFGVTLAGFLRPDSMNVYTHGRRIAE